MSSKFYKTLFIAFLLLGGFLFLAIPIGSLASNYDDCLAACSAAYPTDDQAADFAQCAQSCSAQIPGEDAEILPGGDADTGIAAPGPNSVSLPNFLGSGTNSISGLIVKIIDFLIPLATIFAVFMLIWAGFQFATAQGDPTKITKAKQNFIWTVVGIAVIMASQAIVTYITDIMGGGSGQGSALLDKIEGTLNQIIGLLFVLVTVYFFWGVAEFVRFSASGETAKLEEGKKHMVWGIIGMAIMLGAWGIVQMIQLYFT